MPGFDRALIGTLFIVIYYTDPSLGMVKNFEQIMKSGKKIT